MIQRLIALIVLILSIPLWILFYVLIKVNSEGPVIFKQKRMGKDKKAFVMFKFRTMVKNAEKLKSKYAKVNEVDGPVFKIKDDPRFTGFGKILSHTGLDELPQLINIVRGEMAFVGPRPLPLEEGKHVPKPYEARFSVLPGVTSPWVLKGQHKLHFNQWMKLDVEYVNNRSAISDSEIALKTGLLIMGIIFKKMLGGNG